MDEEDEDDGGIEEASPEGAPSDAETGEETTIAEEGDDVSGAEGLALIDQVETIVRNAAGKEKVVRIRLEVGRSVSASKVRIAAELQKRFPGASVEMKDSKRPDSITVKDIEVE